MFPLVEFPELVQHYARYFEKVFSAEAFMQFKRYLSGLIVSENKTIEGINRLLVLESRNQSSLNRGSAERSTERLRRSLGRTAQPNRSPNGRLTEGD